MGTLASLSMRDGRPLENRHVEGLQEKKLSASVKEWDLVTGRSLKKQVWVLAGNVLMCSNWNNLLGSDDLDVFLFRKANMNCSKEKISFSIQSSILKSFGICAILFWLSLKRGDTEGHHCKMGPFSIQPFFPVWFECVRWYILSSAEVLAGVSWKP